MRGLIDFGGLPIFVSFLLQRTWKLKTTRFRDLILFVGFPDFYKEASLHHLTVELKVFRGFVF